jgi:serine/threonine protein kinase
MASDATSGMVGAREEPSSRYEVLTKIASGGMATVYVGRLRGAVGFSRLVAIKRPHPFVSDDPVLRDGLRHEAKVASMIHHPHVVSVVDVEVLGEHLALILDYVEGGTLGDLATHAERTGVLPSPRVILRVVLDAASGLHAAHVLRDPKGLPLGIVHRDVSPQNILVGLDGQARLTDFGIAKVTTEMERTAGDVLKGKLGYLPPEYIEKRTFGVRSDEYALAVVTWEALAGRRLFKGSTEGETIRRILEGRAPRISEARPELAPIDDVLSRALSPDPVTRFDSVAAFADALEHCARERGWVASSAEVAASIEAAVGERVRHKREAVESSAPRVLTELGDAAQPLPPSPRDALPTLSLTSAAAAAPIESRQEEPRSRTTWKWSAALFALVAGVLGVTLGGRVISPSKPTSSPVIEAPLTSKTLDASVEPLSATTGPAVPIPVASATLPVDSQVSAGPSPTSVAPRRAGPLRRPSPPPSATETRTSPQNATAPVPATSHPRAPPNPYGP